MKILFLVVAHLVSIVACGQNAKTKAEAEDSRWDIGKLNTGQGASFLGPLEKEVVLELNKARSNPKLYGELYLAPLLKLFDGKKNRLTNLETQEGAGAVEECIDQLGKTKMLDLLIPDKDLSKAAFRHTSLQSKTNLIGHTSPNGETFQYRLRNLKFSSTAECIAYGEETARDIVVALLIDDGVPSRGHRKTILNGLYSAVGISAGGHLTYSNMCTLDFGGK